MGKVFPKGAFIIDIFSPGRFALTPMSTVCHSFCGKFPQESAGTWRPFSEVKPDTMFQFWA